MKQTIINPFLNRNKITDERDFFGRKKTIEHLINMLTYPEPQSVAVIGERRYGKSSLLTYIYFLLSEKKDERLQSCKKFICILLDPEEIATDCASDMTWIIIDELISEDPELLKYVNFYPPKEYKKEIPERRPRIILKNLLKEACKNDYKFVFLVDEFELLVKNKKLRETDYLQYLRNLSDNHKLAFITSSRKPLKEICSENDIDTVDTSPFDNNFSGSRYVGLMERNECRELIRGTLERYGFSPAYFEFSEMEEVINLAGEHPYFLKMACAHLFDWITSDRQQDPDWQ
jgi:serine/threonine-protein kinase